LGALAPEPNERCAHKHESDTSKQSYVEGPIHMLEVYSSPYVARAASQVSTGRATISKDPNERTLPMSPPASVVTGRTPSARRLAKTLATNSLGLPSNTPWPDIRATIASYMARGCPVAHDVDAQITDLLDGAHPIS
jgi:hypothetical protein